MNNAASSSNFDNVTAIPVVATVEITSARSATVVVRYAGGSFSFKARKYTSSAPRNLTVAKVGAMVRNELRGYAIGRRLVAIKVVL